MPKINSNVEGLLNQFVTELERLERGYQVARSYFMEAGYTKVSKYFKHIARQHTKLRNKVQHFILDHDGCLDINALPGVNKIQVNDVVADTHVIFKGYYDKVVGIGKDLNKIYIEALSDEDITTCKWIKELIMEQLQMEADAKETMLEMGFAQTKLEIWQIDQHLVY